MQHTPVVSVNGSSIYIGKRIRLHHKQFDTWWTMVIWHWDMLLFGRVQHGFSFPLKCSYHIPSCSLEHNMCSYAPRAVMIYRTLTKKLKYLRYIPSWSAKTYSGIQQKLWEGSQELYWPLLLFPRQSSLQHQAALGTACHISCTPGLSQSRGSGTIPLQASSAYGLMTKASHKSFAGFLLPDGLGTARSRWKQSTSYLLLHVVNIHQRRISFSRHLNIAGAAHDLNWGPWPGNDHFRRVRKFGDAPTVLAAAFYASSGSIPRTVRSQRHLTPSASVKDYIASHVTRRRIFCSESKFVIWLVFQQFLLETIVLAFSSTCCMQ